MQCLAVLTMRITLSICGLWLLMNAPTVSAQQGDESTANCTLVLGFSQTADWYLAPLFRDADDPNRQEAGAIFESIVDGDRWQLMWTNGAGVNVYSNPDSEAWSAPIISPCAEASDRPERIVYMISGPFGEDVQAWVTEIEKAVDNIRDEFPSAKIIALQPVVGAPADAPGDACFTQDGDGRVRASWQATPILEAIEIVADNLDDVVVGATTRVKFCSHFVDGLGHISNGEMISGATDVAVTTGLFYREFDFKPK